MPRDKLRLIYQDSFANHDILQTAVRLASQQHYGDAINLLSTLVEKGETIANCYLGMIYEYGNAEIPENFEYARFYYEMAAKDGWVPGYIGLGRVYYYGLGVEQDLLTAFDYFNKIHEAKVVSPIADYYLGQMYLLGEGVDKDLSRAAYFFERSSGQGYYWARLRLAEIALQKREYIRWFHIRISLLFGTIRFVLRNRSGSWQTTLPTSTMGPSSLSFGQSLSSG